LAPAVTGKGLFWQAAVGFLLPEAVGKSKFKRGALDTILRLGSRLKQIPNAIPLMLSVE